MELIFVRHALPERQTLDNAPADPGLSSVGIAQAAALGEWLAREPIDVIVRSPARRAGETAAPLAQRCGLSPSIVTDLNEFDAGSTSYVPVEDMRASDDPRWQLLRQGLLYGTPEEADRFRCQIVAAVEALVQANPGKRVVVVGHGGVINAYIGHILGIEKPLWFAARYTGISRVLAAKSGERSLETLNEISHLELALACESRSGIVSAP